MVWLGQIQAIKKGTFLTPSKSKIEKLKLKKKLHARVTITRVNNTPKITEKRSPGYVS